MLEGMLFLWAGGGERKGRMAREEMGTVEDWEARALGWEGCTFGVVPIFLGGCRSCYDIKQTFMLTLTLGCSL